MKSTTQDFKAPKGTRDLNTEYVTLRDNIVSIVKKNFELFGGNQIDTPVIECQDTVTNLYGEEFNKLVYTLADQESNENLLLRYDLTVPCARYIGNAGLTNFKRYQIGKVYRKDSPQIANGRFREFMQADFDIIGTDYDTHVQDIEILCLLSKILKELLDDNYIIKLNNRKILYDALKFCGVGSDDIISVCSSIDKLDKADFDKVKVELINIKHLNIAVVNNIEKFYNECVQIGTDKNLLLKKLLDANFITDTTYAEMNIIFGQLDDFSYNVKFDPLLARGLDYYTGIIFEAKYKDANIFSSSIAAGGRYDNMLEKFSNKGHIPAIGLSVGIDRLMSVIDKNKFNIHNTAKVFVASIGKNMEFHKLRLVYKLRSCNIKTEFLYLKDPKMRPQFDFVFNKKIPFMIVLGEDEVKNNKITLKNIRDNEEYKSIDFEYCIKIIEKYDT
jgi:histidyl-tRNA synthetase